MTPLRQRMIEDMQLRGLSSRTQQSSVREVSQLALHYGTSPDLLTDEDLRQYFLYLRNQKQASRSSCTVALCAIKFFFERTLQRPWPLLELVRPPQAHTLPVVLSPDEVWQILAQIHLPHYPVCLSIIYACGLRLREGVGLRVAQIDSARMQRHIQGGKGNKDRYVPLPPRALTLLRRHWQTHRNPVWLFPAYNDRPRLAQTASAPFDVRGVQRAFQLAVQVSGVHKPASVIPCAIPGGARSGVWLLRRWTRPTSKRRSSHPGDAARQDQRHWSASRGQERVVRGRPTRKKQTLRTAWDGLAALWRRRDMTKTRLAYAV